MTASGRPAVCFRSNPLRAISIVGFVPPGANRRRDVRMTVAGISSSEIVRPGAGGFIDGIPPRGYKIQWGNHFRLGKASAADHPWRGIFS